MEAKASQMTSLNAILSPHENNEEGGSPLDLKIAHKCNEST
jgi:hypothetical protein